MNENNLELFTELTEQESSEVNGGLYTYNNYTQQALGSALGASGSEWWRRNFYGALAQGNFNAALGATDRYIGGLRNSLGRFGIFV